MIEKIVPIVAPDARRRFATEVVARLRAEGFQALFAGGCVRDLILGGTPADYDVATDATPERVMALFRRTVPVVAAERIAQELRKMLVDPSRARAMDLAFEAGLVRAVLPPLVKMRGLFQGKPMQPDGDLWDHTLLVLENLPPDPSFPLAFAA